MTILRGPRVLLRPMEPSDDEACAAILSDPETMSHLLYMSKRSVGGWTPSDAATRREAQLARNRDGTGLSLAIIINNRLAGSVGFTSIDPPNRSGNCGIILSKEFQRGGYGTEALYLVLDHAFEVMKLHRLEMGTDVENAAMRGWLEGLCGVKPEGIRRDMMWDSELERWCSSADYAILEDEWFGGIRDKLKDRVYRA
ncbi:hypothetical protein HK104_003092 [Borealophlyctis nickersoniae]|nr:hypothetical protein HK104_003092 [Borealophlyctis nickersoniae]